MTTGGGEPTLAATMFGGEPVLCDGETDVMTGDTAPIGSIGVGLLITAPAGSMVGGGLTIGAALGDIFTVTAFCCPGLCNVPTVCTTLTGLTEVAVIEGGLNMAALTGELCKVAPLLRLALSC